MTTVANKFRRRASSALARDEEEKIELIDFKMVTFSLAGKDYGIDIMKVKEIARFVNFTYVPNTPPFVRGVYNLRGEIISIIDLRGMFNLPHDKKSNGEEEAGLILRLETNLIGVVVDKIDKVVGINSDTIQPPHPIFGDINIKYISGVVENEGRLYIILDVEKILGKQDEQSNTKSGYGTPVSKVSSQADSAPEVAKGKSPSSKVSDDELTLQFISESLAALENFHVSSLNKNWVINRFQEWKQEREDSDLQLQTKTDAQNFLRTFHSSYTGLLWSDEYAKKFMDSLPREMAKQVNVWNPGCGKGYESYCVAVALRLKYPNSAIRVWASDKDLLNISAAPSLVFEPQSVPDWMKEFVVEAKGGLSFNQKIKDILLFEYHDITNTHTMPPVQITVARDLLSYLHPEQVKVILNELNDRVKGQGIICLGSNEQGTLEFGLSPIDKNPLGFCKFV